MNVKKAILIVVLLVLVVGLSKVDLPIAKAQTIKEVIEQISQLQSQLNELLEKEPRAWCYNFENDLKQGGHGPEVRVLQAALEAEGFKIEEGEKLNNYFGSSTLSAVILFQEKYKKDILEPWGLQTGTGYVGKTTRTKLNELYGCAPAPKSESEYKCPDINGDGTVNIKDISAISINIGACLGDAKYNATADVNWDECLTTADTDFVGKFYGKSINQISQCTGVIYYSLTIKVSGQGTTAPSLGTYTYRKGEKIGITATPASGWRFNYWTGADSTYDNPTAVTLDSDKTVTVFFKEKPLPKSESEYKCPDINGDGKVDIKDITAISANIGVCEGNPKYNATADVNWDECLTTADTDFVSKFFGKSIDEIEQCGGISKYSLTIKVNGQGTTEPSPKNYLYLKGAQVSITALPASGWEFRYWTGADDNNLNPTTVTLTSDKTVTAFFKEKPLPKPACIDADRDGYFVFDEIYCLAGNDCNDANSNINPGVIEICNDGIDNNCNGYVDSRDPYCQPAPKPELEYKCPDINGDGTVNIKDISAIASNLGACLGDEKYNATADVNWDECLTTADTDFVGKFYGKSINQISQCTGVIYYSLTIKVSGQGTTAPSLGTYTYRKGEKIGITATPASGWRFNYWTGTDNNSINPTTVTLTSDKTVTAYFKEKLAPKPESESKCPDINGDGTVNIKDISVIAINLGACLGQPNYNLAADVNWDECLTTADSDFVSKFFGKNTDEIEQCGGIPKYSLTIKVNGQGSTTPQIGTYTHRKGEKIGITATPASGWLFSYWTGADNNNLNPTTVTLTSDKIVTAYFKEKEKLAPKPESEYKCPDINGDGTVDIRDISTISLNLGACEGDANYDSLKDVNWDGCLTTQDTDFVSKFFGKSASQIEQCTRGTTLKFIESAVASIANSISQILEAIKELLK